MKNMPEVCRFHGMSIKLFWNDHPPKHIHVFSGDDRLKITFEGKILSGKMEQHKLRILRDWLIKRHNELNDRWEKIMNNQPFERIGA